MQDNICGNCDYCDKKQMRCIAKHESVKETDSCQHYFNIKKTEIYNLILNTFSGLEKRNQIMQEECKNCKMGQFCEENNTIKDACKYVKPKDKEIQENVLSELRY